MPSTPKQLFINRPASDGRLYTHTRSHNSKITQQTAIFEEGPFHLNESVVSYKILCFDIKIFPCVSPRVYSRL